MLDPKKLSDHALQFLLAQAESKVESFSKTTTAAGAALLQAYRERLDELRLELERRSHAMTQHQPGGLVLVLKAAGGCRILLCHPAEMLGERYCPAVAGGCGRRGAHPALPRDRAQAPSRERT